MNGSSVLAQIDRVDESQSLSFDVRVTKAGTTAATVQLFVQDSNDGGTWDDLLSSNAFAFTAVAGTTQRFRISQQIDSTAVQGGAVSDKALAAGTVRKGPIGSMLRIVEVIAGAVTPVAVEYQVALTVK